MNSTTPETPTLDLHCLENVRQTGDKTTFRCPACANEGKDRTGNHGVIFLASGKFTCVVDPQHRSEIWKRAGLKGQRSGHPRADRLTSRQSKRERLIQQGKDSLHRALEERRRELLEKYAWDFAEVWEESPLRLEGAEADDPRLFLECLFPSEATVWTGHEWESGQAGRHSHHWRTVAEWTTAHWEELGPMVSPAIWPEGTTSRTARNVIAVPYVVLDFDGPPGRPPRTDADMKRHVVECLALINWLKNGMGWRLSALLHTGSKSLHAWFQHPGGEILATLKDVASELGIDLSLIGHPEHPARLPGQVHRKTGQMSSIRPLTDKLAPPLFDQETPSCATCGHSQ